MSVLAPPAGRTPAFIVVVAGHVAVAVLLLSAAGPRAFHEAADALQVSIFEAPRTTATTVPEPVPTLIVPVVTAALPELQIAMSIDTVTPTPVAVTAEKPEPRPAVVAMSESAKGDYVVSEADYLKRPSLRYPPLAQRQRQCGTVLLRVMVGLDGHPQQVRVERSSGYPLLDRAAQDAVRAALFRPFVVGGSARVAEVVVPIEFLLRTG